MFLFKRIQSNKKSLAARKAAQDSKTRNMESEKDYPTTKLPTFREDSPFDGPFAGPFAGATPASGGSWIICHDQDGQTYWWNDVTGQCTYQLFSTQGPYTYVPEQQQQQSMATLYSPQYVPQHPWLMSPAGQFNNNAPWSPEVVASAGAGWGKQEDVNKKVLDSVDEGNWVKYHDGMGRYVWVHSVTGERSSEEPSVV